MAKLYRYETTDGNTIACKETDGFEKPDTCHFYHPEYGFVVITNMAVFRKNNKNVFCIWSKQKDDKRAKASFTTSAAIPGAVLKYDGRDRSLSVLSVPKNNSFGDALIRLRESSIRLFKELGLAETRDEALALYESAECASSITKNGCEISADCFQTFIRTPEGNIALSSDEFRDTEKTGDLCILSVIEDSGILRMERGLFNEYTAKGQLLAVVEDNCCLLCGEALEHICRLKPAIERTMSGRPARWNDVEIRADGKDIILKNSSGTEIRTGIRKIGEA